MRTTNDNYGNLYLRINDILKAKGINVEAGELIKYKHSDD